ncbi:hypothetical protein BB560_006413 [Smittium megazygosporum]|uniref:Glycosyltransferase family 15 protein n=1 Tax=Smittium megazygosporum TaxID=133381 RepID=A0A2T9Y6R1_9FUNG|nr:hypothetical protein BB560_006413 [Smittium megazygosporum]
MPRWSSHYSFSGSSSKAQNAYNSNPFDRINAPYDNWPPPSANDNISLNGTNNIRAAFVTVVRNQDYEALRIAIKQIDDLFNKDYVYPYIILNDEEFNLYFKKSVLTSTKAPIYFGKIDQSMWNLSPDVNLKKVEKMIADKKFDYVHGDSISYRKIFYSNFIHKHPLLRNVDYYWRFQADVKYFCRLDFDPFARMKKMGYKYGWVISPVEFEETVKTLWKTTAEWILKNKSILPSSSFSQFLFDKGKNKYNNCHFWTNFEIVDTSFLRSKVYESFVTALDKAGGFFYERWGDAPIRTIAASMLLSKKEIHWFEEIGYERTGNKHCPRPEKFAFKCFGCDAENENVYDSPCYKHFLEAEDSPKSNLIDTAKAFLESNA